MRHSITFAGSAAIGAIALCASSASALVFPYGNFPGAGTNPDFVSVQEDTNAPGPNPAAALFGAPIRVGNSLLFFPTQYSSESTNGGADTTSSTLSMFIFAKPGQFLKSFTIRERGDWTLTGIGTAATQANINGALFITDIGGGGGFWQDVMTVNPPMPQTGSPSFGIWESAVTIDLTGLGVTSVQLQFNNNLQTSSEPGTTAFIQKKVINGPSVQIEIPAPAGVSVLALMGLAGARRRRA
ncbi:MAG TPA: hypothetical protein DEB06_03260 [Phycisphaerales bacterium]|nr:hypothetical protein [Phycisphaerales bacterium]